MKQYNQQPSLVDLLIATIASGRSTHRFKSILRERAFKRYAETTIRNAVTRLHRKKYIKNSSLGWSLTEHGKNFSQKRKLIGYIPSPFPKQCSASIILAFDIPERDRKIRNWLRNQIKIFGYKMLQQSLWIGPGPLPPAFTKRLESLGIRKNVKTFKISTRK